MRRAAHNGCCRRAAQVRALSSVLWKLLISEELMEVLLNVEMPLVNILMHPHKFLWGISNLRILTLEKAQKYSL